MSDKNYPVPYFKDLNRPRPAHSIKEEQALQADGWTDDYRLLPHQEYPKALYAATGEVILCGDYDKEGVVDIVKAKKQEKALLADGYQTKRPLQPAVRPQMEAPSGARGNILSRLDELETRSFDVDARLADIEAQLQIILDSVKQEA